MKSYFLFLKPENFNSTKFAFLLLISYLCKKKDPQIFCVCKINIKSVTSVYLLRWTLPGLKKCILMWLSYHKIDHSQACKESMKNKKEKNAYFTEFSLALHLYITRKRNYMYINVNVCVCVCAMCVCSLLLRQKQ